MHEVAKNLSLAGLILLLGGMAGAMLGSKVYGSLLGMGIGLLLLASGGIILLF